MSKFENSNLINSDSEEETDLNLNQTNKDKKKKKKPKSKNVKSTESEQNKPISTMGKLIMERKRLLEEENERIRKIEEEEEIKKKKEEEILEKNKKEEKEEKERKEKKYKAKQDKIEAQKKAGQYKTKSEKKQHKKNQLRLEQMKKLGIVSTDSDGKIIIKQDTQIQIKELETESESESESESETELNNNKEIQINNFRCPIFTIMGHVDTGKTTLLDYLRKTSVQSHEAGGITQQIGTTLLTRDIISKQINLSDANLDANLKIDIKIPGLLLIDTPGHESFEILRKLGSKLADIAIVIIDIMHGLEPQTIESIKFLKESNVPFMFVLNKIDRLYGWNNQNLSGNKLLDAQNFNTKEEFYSRFKQIQTQIMIQGINSELYWSNTSVDDTINIIPISAVTGQGISDLLTCIINYSQTFLSEQIKWVEQLECIIMEISNDNTYGYTLDCILKNGQLSKGDTIQIQSHSNIIKTKIKNILTIPENKDSKYISKYTQHQTIKGTCQIKIVASNIETSQIGSKIFLIPNETKSKSFSIEKVEIEEKVEEQNKIQLNSQGICIFTSTKGSMESFIQYAQTNTELINPIQIAYTSIGNVNKKELVKFNLINTSSTLGITDIINSLENELKPENICVLAFEVEIDKEAIQYAKDNKIHIFHDNTIYRLFNQYKEFANTLYLDRKEKMRTNTVFPCILKIIESNIFNKKNPLIIGVEVLEGTLHLGTPLIIIPSKTLIGKVVGIQVNKQDVKVGKTGQSICIKIDNISNPGIMYGRHFTHKDLLYPNITRASIDLLKKYFKKDISKEDIGLLVKLKKLIEF